MDDFKRCSWHSSVKSAFNRSRPRLIREAGFLFDKQLFVAHVPIDYYPNLILVFIMNGNVLLTVCQRLEIQKHPFKQQQCERQRRQQKSTQKENQASISRYNFTIIARPSIVRLLSFSAFESTLSCNLHIVRIQCQK